VVRGARREVPGFDFFKRLDMVKTLTTNQAISWQTLKYKRDNAVSTPSLIDNHQG
jgi:hypothetical protein